MTLLKKETTTSHTLQCPHSHMIKHHTQNQKELGSKSGEHVKNEGEKSELNSYFAPVSSPRRKGARAGYDYITGGVRGGTTQNKSGEG